jgi:hypothetical protein
MSSQTASATIESPTTKSLPDSLPYPLTDNEQLVEMLVEVLGQTTEVVREVLYQASFRRPSIFSANMRS